jgi:hypothetical protein
MDVKFEAGNNQRINYNKNEKICNFKTDWIGSSDDDDLSYHFIP